MNKRLSISLPVIFGVVVSGAMSNDGQQRQLMPPTVQCRHGAAEQKTDRTRRENALALAKAINAAQGTLAERTRRYHPLAELRNLPGVPAGFELRFYSDAGGYIFSLKDALDSCRYAIFSDQSGLLYENSARQAPEVATE